MEVLVVCSKSGTRIIMIVIFFKRVVCFMKSLVLCCQLKKEKSWRTPAQILQKWSLVIIKCVLITNFA